MLFLRISVQPQELIPQNYSIESYDSLVDPQNLICIVYHGGDNFENFQSQKFGIIVKVVAKSFVWTYPLHSYIIATSCYMQW